MELTSILGTSFLVNVDSVVYAYTRGSGATLVMSRNKELVYVTESVSEVVTASGTGLVAFTATEGDVTGSVAINPNYIQTVTSVDGGDSSGLILGDNSGVRATLVVTTDYANMDAIVEASAGGTSYSVYTAILTQSTTGDPTATVLENTLGGTVVWARSEAGIYTATLEGAFTANKTAVPNPGLTWETSAKYTNVQVTDTDTITLYVTSEDGTTSVDDWTCPCFEIRVYP